MSSIKAREPIAARAYTWPATARGSEAVKTASYSSHWLLNANELMPISIIRDELSSHTTCNHRLWLGDPGSARAKARTVTSDSGTTGNRCRNPSSWLTLASPGGECASAGSTTSLGEPNADHP